MSLKANYFKLGLFVIGAIVAGAVVLVVIGSGRWFQPKLTIETYFNESVQGLDVGSKLKYRGVAIGEVTRIGFTYNKYQLDRPMAQRARYVLVEAQIEPRLLGGRAAAGDITNPENARMEIERGLRMCLAPQGITGTSYLEIDYVDPPPSILPIDWTPDNTYIPGAQSTVTTFVNSAIEVLDNCTSSTSKRSPRTSTSSWSRRMRGSKPSTRGRSRSAGTACSPRWSARSTTSIRRSCPTRV